MHDDPNFSKHYRDAMAHYAGHVQIVTTAHGGVLRGVGATIFQVTFHHYPV